LAGHASTSRAASAWALCCPPSDSPLSLVTVIPTSTSAGPSVHRPELDIAGRPTRMLVDQIRSIDSRYVVGEPVDYLSRDQLVEVESALTHYLGMLHAD
jgi:mRNA interferase MazF